MKKAPRILIRINVIIIIKRKSGVIFIKKVYYLDIQKGKLYFVNQK